MTEITPKATLPKYKAAAITFIVINGLSVIQGLLVLFMDLGGYGASRGIADPHILLMNALMSLYAVSFLATSAYALVIGCLVLARKSAGLWMSGAIVSIVAGALGMVLIILHLPVAIWLIIVIKRLRRQSNIKA